MLKKIYKNPYAAKIKNPNKQKTMKMFIKKNPKIRRPKYRMLYRSI